MRVGIFRILFLVTCAAVVGAQENTPEMVTRLNEAINNTALFVDTYSVEADSSQQMNMELMTEGERFMQKTVQQSVLTASVRELEDGATRAFGELLARFQQDEVEPGQKSSESSQVVGELRLADDTLFVNLQSDGSAAPVMPTGWTPLLTGVSADREFENRFAFDFPGSNELAFEELLGFEQDEEGATRGIEFLTDIIALADATSVGTERLGDGSRVERSTVELYGPRVLQIEPFAEEILDSTEDIPAPFLNALFENLVLRMAVLIDEAAFFRGFSLDIQFMLESDDLRSVLGDMVPEDVEGSIMLNLTMSEDVTYVDLNEDLPTISPP